MQTELNEAQPTKDSYFFLFAFTITVVLQYSAFVAAYVRQLDTLTDFVQYMTFVSLRHPSLGTSRTSNVVASDGHGVSPCLPLMAWYYPCYPHSPSIFLDFPMYHCTEQTARCADDSSAAACIALALRSHWIDGSVGVEALTFSAVQQHLPEVVFLSMSTLRS